MPDSNWSSRTESSILRTEEEVRSQYHPSTFKGASFKHKLSGLAEVFGESYMCQDFVEENDLSL